MTPELKWLLKQSSFLIIYRIELDLEMPEGTLAKFVKGSRELPENWHKPVSDWVRKFRK
jgi:hypothetical protein